MGGIPPPMLSVSQIHAQIKILEVWKAVNVENHPNKVKVIKHDQTDRTSRGMTKGLLQENITPKTCIGDAVRLWNKAPETIRSAKSLAIAKKVTKNYCKTLPI